MLQHALALLLAVGLPLPYAASTWPLDTIVVQQVERASTIRQSSKERVLRQAVAFEQGSVLAADMLFIGIWGRDAAPTAWSYGRQFDAAWVRIERCLKGDCADSVLLHRWVRSPAFVNAPLGTRQPDWSVPESGQRCLFLARGGDDDSTSIFGGYGHDRYDLDGGLVVSKGVPESEFVSAIVELLEVVEGFERGAAESEEAAVQPSN
jgi:hypothetical protein